MRVEFYENTIKVIRESTDIRMKDESQLLYHLKKKLNEIKWFDLVKVRMWKDGHLVDERQQYLRQRKPTRVAGKYYPDYDVYIYNHRWAVNDAHVDFNTDGVVTLSVVYDIYRNGESNARD